MSEVTVGRWGKNLAVRIPVEVASATGVTDGERVHIESRDGEIVIRRAAAKAAAESLAAAEEIIAEADAYRLTDKEIEALLHEGRRE